MYRRIYYILAFNQNVAFNDTDLHETFHKNVHAHNRRTNDK